MHITEHKMKWRKTQELDNILNLETTKKRRQENLCLMRRLDQHGEKKTKPWWVGAEITDTSEPLIISRLWCSPNSVIFSYAIARRDCMQHHNVNQHSYRPRPVEGPNACWSCQTESKSERYWIFTLLNKAKKRKNKSKKYGSTLHGASTS